MDNKKNGIPKLRFPGFTGAWEQRKLGEVIVSEHKGKVKSSMKGGNTNYLETNYLNGGTAQKVDAIADVSKDDVLILWDGSKAGTIYHGFEGALGSTLKAYVPKYSGDFLYQILKKNQDKIYQSYRTPNIPHVIKNFTEKFNVSIPTIIEQQEIGDFFKQLDSLITLHQRKLEHLQEQKKGLLQKMFPKNGETVPEVRFPGFTDAWEQRKLGEVATRVTRKNKNLESTLPLTISARLGLVDQISYFDKRIASSNLTNYILLNRGEFAYNKSYSNGYPFGTVKRLNRYDKGVIPSLYIAFMPNTIFINSDFMEMYFETSLWHKEVSARASEGARNHGLLNISPSDFMDIYMKIPEKIEEQKKIAKFLEDFDSLIALHQRKLEHLELMKKGLLQQMFV
ncbi:restriction endonuclease subunit S [Ligilactobacillus salivarius]|uniref:restriction endonuclease subunit S n=1 Tax=Ligilactobacillus salivarius TaxID=1624 RepID=UPI0024BB48D4|nr:restriction endonuclease subunit S [Ligilactobacillus salivarius]